MKYFVYSLLALILVSPAFAERVAAKRIASPDGAQECPFVETSNINVNFNSIETDLQKITNIMSAKIGEIEALGKEKGMTKVALQSSNYSISVSNGMACSAGNCQFQFYGNASFLVEPASQASGFMAYLVEKGFVANLNVNSYRQCS